MSTSNCIPLRLLLVVLDSVLLRFYGETEYLHFACPLDIAQERSAHSSISLPRTRSALQNLACKPRPVSVSSNTAPDIRSLDTCEYNLASTLAGSPSLRSISERA
jgi:hypothetical protein